MLGCYVAHCAAIGNAYAVLSNPEKRQQYDQYGDQSPADTSSHNSAQSRHAYTHHRNFTRDFEADISPEELFNIFFGGRFPTGLIMCGDYCSKMDVVSLK